MPRDPNGDYNLPLPPVTASTVIATTWANPTMDDLAVAATDSLSRSGKGAMQAPIRNVVGSAGLPAITFNDDPGSGAYLFGVNDMRVSINSVDVMRWTDGSVEIWDGVAFREILVAGLIGSNDVANESTVPGSSVTTALNQLALDPTTDGVGNDSTLPGVYLTEALDSIGTDNVANTSGVTGVTTTDALNTLNAASSPDSDDVANVSFVPGASVSDALDNLDSTISALGSSSVANNSSVPGPNVTDALNTLQSDTTNLSSDDIANDSVFAGVSVTDAFNDIDSDTVNNTLGGNLGPTITSALDVLEGYFDNFDSSDAANVSTVTGATVTDALNTLDAAAFAAGGGGDPIAVKSVNTVTFSEVYTPIPQLDGQLAITGGKTYHISGTLSFAADSPGVDVRLTFGVTTGVRIRGDYNQTSLGNPGNLRTVFSQSTDPEFELSGAEVGQETLLSFDGVFSPTTTGTIGVDFRKSSSATGSIWAQMGSFLQIKELY